MRSLDIRQFGAYFRELHRREPYSWQLRLAEMAVKGNWPGAIDLPTASGKTACIDIAVFALACQASCDIVERNAPRRLFFCVNRRVIVDEAHRRSRGIAEAIWSAERNNGEDTPVLCDVAAALRVLAGSTPQDNIPPLDVLELRGGIYRDNRWARSATQPMIVCTTIDQIGSRLLFRGYGVSDNAAPIQAALIAYDSLILLDEAHISRPFLQTLTNVQHYLEPEKWAAQPIGVSPVVVVPMTATPPGGVGGKDVIQLTEEDRKNKSLTDRLGANKLAELREVKEIAVAAVAAAEDLASDKPAAVGVIVNRVATARAIFQTLRKSRPDAIVELVIGSMRPIDRDTQATRLRNLIGPERPAVTTQSSFVIATQCLEVGADYDFDVLVTECASLDALRQRFGRLNRGGRRDAKGDPLQARAIVLMSADAVKPKKADPIYGEALPATWQWLSQLAADNMVNFGIDPFDALLAANGENCRIPAALLAPAARLDAPVMLPTYVDFWCQTAPRPVPDPDISLFLHGQQRAEPDVQVCWRGDLTEKGHMTREHWCDVVALLPPTSAECMTVSISRVRRWLAQQQPDANDSDLLGVALDEDEGAGKKDPNHRKRPTLVHRGVLWRGTKESQLIQVPQDLRPGDTLVMPAVEGGWNELGHIPCPAGSGEKEPILADAGGNADASWVHHIDLAETAYQIARDRAALRLHPSLRSRLPAGGPIDELFKYAADLDAPTTATLWRDLLNVARGTLADDQPELKATLSQLAGISNGLLCEPYPDGEGVVLATRKRLFAATTWYLPSLDEGDDEISRTRRERPVRLADHTKHVVKVLAASLSPLPLDTFTNALKHAALLHDLGKADERFQAMLLRTDRTDCWLLTGLTSSLLAKSDGLPQTRVQQRIACQRAGLPESFRHEMLSVQLAQRAPDLPEDPLQRDLVFHLIAAHHGYARPFAPVVFDDHPPDVKVHGISMSGTNRLAGPAHRLDSGIAERFFSLTRHYGWWGLAYLESLLRLADQQASAAEDSGTFTETPIERTTESRA